MAYCSRRKLNPYVLWDDVSPYYVAGGWQGSYNVWEYYFEPVSDVDNFGDVEVHRNYYAPDNSGLKPQCATVEGARKWAYGLIRKYVRPRNYIKKEVYKFVNDFFEDKYVVGIHLRGTDKNSEIKQTDPKVIFSCANEHAQKIQNKEVIFFVATDEKKLLTLAQQSLNKPVISYSCQRSENGRPLHARVASNRALAGQEVLIDALLLSRTNYLVHTCSNVSSAALFFNPELAHKHLGKLTTRCFCDQSYD